MEAAAATAVGEATAVAAEARGEEEAVASARDGHRRTQDVNLEPMIREASLASAPGSLPPDSLEAAARLSMEPPARLGKRLVVVTMLVVRVA